MNHSQAKHKKDEPRHNMLVVGEKGIFLSHLPMFMVPHNLQFLLDVAFTNKGNDLYFNDRQNHRDTKIYTLEPEVRANGDLIVDFCDSVFNRSGKSSRMFSVQMHQT